jgi:hypothetical protein
MRIGDMVGTRDSADHDTIGPLLWDWARGVARVLRTPSRSLLLGMALDLVVLVGICVAVSAVFGALSSVLSWSAPAVPLVLGAWLRRLTDAQRQLERPGTPADDGH